MLIVSLFSGLTIGAGAAPGQYTVTFTPTYGHATVQVNGGTVTSAQTAADGTLTFSVTADGNYQITYVRTDAPTAIITKNSAGSYTISNVEQNNTVTIVASTNYTGQTSPGGYLIGNESQLSQLASIVNNSSPSAPVYAGSVFTLVNNITLSSAWTPIGGQSAEDSSTYAPNGRFFGGLFDGNNYAISNMNIAATPTGANYAGWGLFGCASNTIANLTVNGTINLNGTSHAPEYVGGIVGYTNGSVYNCQTNVVIGGNSNAQNGSNVGGVVGAIESMSQSTDTADTIKVQYSSASGNISAQKRIGGVVGGTYAKVNGKVRVDNCAYLPSSSASTIVLTSTSGASKAYAGGIVGYSRGWVSRSYAAQLTLYSSGGHYLAGAVGILQGNNPTASIYNSYANVVDFHGTDPNYDMPFVASVDDSNIVPLSACVWVDTPPYVQPSDARWGAWSGGTGPVAAGAINSGTTLGILGDAFMAGSAYPILTWQQSASSRVFVDPAVGTNNNTPGGVNPYTDVDEDNAIFVDGTKTTSGNGTKSSPFNNFEDAAAAASGWSGTHIIYVRGTLNLSTYSATWTLPGDYVLKRSSIFDGYLASVSGVHLTLSGITIDGNKAVFSSITPCNSLFLVNSGDLVIDSGATLRNNYASNGGAVRVMGGTLSMSGGTVTGNVAATNGGAIGVYQTGGTFTMTGGSIYNNSSQNDGGAVAVYSGGAFTFSGGTIFSNTATRNGGGLFVGSGNSGATATLNGGTLGGTSLTSGNKALNGGGVYVDLTGTLNVGNGLIVYNTATNNGGGAFVAVGGTATITGGTISGNSAATGAGIYVTASNELTLSPSGSGAITFGANDAIYLPTGATFNIGARLDTGVSGNVPLSFQNPQVDADVAIASTSDIALYSYGKLTSGTIVFGADGTYIYIVKLSII
jgi:hypothetical protein